MLYGIYMVNVCIYEDVYVQTCIHMYVYMINVTIKSKNYAFYVKK